MASGRRPVLVLPPEVLRPRKRRPVGRGRLMVMGKNGGTSRAPKVRRVRKPVSPIGVIGVRSGRDVPDGRRRPYDFVEVTIPGLKILPQVNQRDEWWETAKETRRVHEVVLPVLRAYGHKVHCWPLIALAMALSKRPPTRTYAPVIVTMTRLSPGTLDRDNARGATKSVQDAVAKWMGVDDGLAERSGWVEWRTEQEKGPYGVKIEIRDRTRTAAR